MIVSILVVTLLAIPFGETVVPETMFQFPASPANVLFRLDILGALRPEYFPYLFTFFVPDFFGTMGIILGIAKDVYKRQITGQRKKSKPSRKRT